MIKRAAISILVGFVAFLTTVQQSGGRTDPDPTGARPVLTCTGDSLRTPGGKAKTCVAVNPSEGVHYQWYGYGLVNGQNAPCAEWNLPGPKYVYVTNLRTGEVSICMAMVLGDGLRYSGVPMMPDVPRPMIATGGEVVESQPNVAPQKPGSPAALSDAYPNPFNPVTVIRYTLFVPGYVRLNVYNALGQEVSTLEDGARAPGIHTYTWDASAFPAGLYFVHLDVVDAAHPTSVLMETRKVLLVK